MPCCDEAHGFCIVEPSPREYVALYTYNTHPSFRECPVPRDPEYVFPDEQADGVQAGMFKALCSGAVFDLAGRRRFGPAPRDLDRLPVHRKGDYLEVDLKHLICQDVGWSRLSAGPVQGTYPNHDTGLVVR